MADESSAEDDAADRLRDAERNVLQAQQSALEAVNQELQRHRASAEKSLAESRALLARREAALDEERSRAAALEQAIAQIRLELEVVLERQRLAPARLSAIRRPESHRRRRRKARPIQPPKKADMKPSTTPISVPSPPAITPIVAVCHMPTTMAARRSRPKKSVPSGYCQLGGRLVGAASG